MAIRCGLLCLSLLVTAVVPCRAAGIWTYTDEHGVVHVGNVAPPGARRVEWLGFDDRVKALPMRSVGPQTLTRLPGYAEVRRFLESAALRYDVDPRFVTAVAAAESGFRTNAISRKGAVGLMQVMPSTALRYGMSGDESQLIAVLKNPDVNAQVGTRYLADLVRMFEGELELAVAAYNAGEGAVLRHGRRVPPYPETQQYVGRVLRYYRMLTGHSQ